MRTYTIDISVHGMGLRGLFILTLAIIAQMIIYNVYGLLCFLIGFIMFMVGGLFGRSVQKHYDQDTKRKLVGVPVSKHGVVWYRKLFFILFPWWWFMDGLWHHGNSGVISFSCLHLTGGDVWW